MPPPLSLSWPKGLVAAPGWKVAVLIPSCLRVKAHLGLDVQLWIVEALGSRDFHTTEAALSWPLLWKQCQWYLLNDLKKSYKGFDLDYDISVVERIVFLVCILRVVVVRSVAFVQSRREENHQLVSAWGSNRVAVTPPSPHSRGPASSVFTERGEVSAQPKSLRPQAYCNWLCTFPLHSEGVARFLDFLALTFVGGLLAPPAWLGWCS